MTGDTPIGDLLISLRSYNALTRVGITTVAQLLDMTEHEIADVPGIGAKAKAELVDIQRGGLSDLKLRRPYEELHAENQQLRDALRDALPYVLGAAAQAVTDGQRLQWETTHEILDSIRDALGISL